MPASPYDEIKTSIRDYGAAAFQNLLQARALGEAVIARFHNYLGCEREKVAGVPAQGPFDPREDYGEKAFSYYGRDVIILEPVRFGVSLIVGNLEDSGALWLRTVVAAEIAGDHFDVFVGAQPALRIPLDFAPSLDDVFKAMHREFLDTFELQVLEFEDQRFKTGIGFLPTRDAKSGQR
ncbi:MAG: hypothetical protein ABL957_10665 [Parvularculaceae bacterium]